MEQGNAICQRSLSIMERYRVYSGTALADASLSKLPIRVGRESVRTSELRLVSIARIMPPNSVTTAEENRLEVPS